MRAEIDFRTELQRLMTEHAAVVLHAIPSPCYTIMVLRAMPSWYSMLYHHGAPNYSFIVLNTIPSRYSALFHHDTP